MALEGLVLTVLRCRAQLQVKVEVGEIWCGHGANVGRTIKIANYIYGDFYRITQLFRWALRDRGKQLFVLNKQ